MKISNISLEDALQNDRINTFIKKSNNGTIFHEPYFLSYHKKKFNNQEKFLVWEEQNQIISLVPYIIEKNIFKSPYGGSFGGMIFNINEKFSKVEEITISFIDYLKLNKIRKCLLTPTPILYHSKANNYFEYLCIKNGFKISNTELTSIIELDDNFKSFFTKSCVKGIKKAKNIGIEVSVSNNYEEFYKILSENRKLKNVVPTHSFDEIINLKNKYADNVILFEAKLDNKVISGSLVFICNTKVALDFYWCHKETFQSTRSLNHLIEYMCKYLKKKNIKIFDLGRITDKEIINYGGTFFKESFGAHGVLKPTYCYEI